MTNAQTWAAPPLPAGPRRALVVATATYTDPALRRLRSPVHDAAALREVLADPAAGGFEVTEVTDGGAGDVRRAVVDFTASCDRDDLALVYLSCHGLLDARRRLWFASADTVKAQLAATAVEAGWLMDRMEDCRARAQVVVLDCCFSGAFAQGAKGEDALVAQLKARGTVVLTASRATEYSFEGDPLEPHPSVFTAALVEGLRSGAADTDDDGLITVDEAFAFAHRRVVAAAPGQTPQRWSFGTEAPIVLARNPAGMRVTAAPVPPDLRALLDHPRPGIRAAALDTLGEWLGGGQPAQIVAARAELRRIADEDLPRVGERARELLGEQAVRAPAKDDLDGIRLLWLDDEPESNEILVRSFTARGAVVYPAMTTNQAVQFLGAVGFNALISDVTRKGREVGFDDLSRIRATGYGGPAVFFTARVTDDLRAQAKASGADGVLSSAGELDEWLRRVCLALTRRTAHGRFDERMRAAFNDG
ncbi:CheY chemotaxis protein or a CheY-like REC (receiver) domain [Asanoa hainanensis]|uniref:CheY chemotaxis protein or a CheY-like REC (Receiver) domain n=1 Tax=Asanoa hainanensis TaxID=560556 RepID=A0A239GTV6_9ACTN|nr:caspase family protein [Asanoa hainanensis]SNS72649.1 CheY chemotaxis protein or a CheY-like REC (receiver) domain [Asanoa hainanensis]